MRNLLQALPEGAVPLRPVDKHTLTSYAEEASEFERNQLANQQFKAAFGTRALITDVTGTPTVVLVGTEAPPEDPRAFIHLFAQVGGDLPPRAYTLDPAAWPGLDIEAAAIGWGLACYQFDRYLKSDPTRPVPELYIEGLKLRRVQRSLAAVFLARDLINTPAADMGPEDLATRAGKLAARHEGHIDLIMGGRLAREYPAVHAVGKGSHRAPTLIDLRWGNEAHPKLTIVGKGVVFDTGGLDIKPAAGMLLMKKDMGGAAVALGLTQLIMESKLPVRLRTLIPAVENAVSAEAYRPGDVVTTRKGLTVEIGNTDAEGRVILCDALAAAVEEEPDLIIDLATLTGACRVALGQDLPGFYSPDDALARALNEAAAETGDPVWHMPLWAPYLKGIKGTISDLNNISSSPMGGSITAALYLHEFVKPFRNWLHLDIYGWRTEALPGSPKGGEASALRAVYRLLENRYAAT